MPVEVAYQMLRVGHGHEVVGNYFTDALDKKVLTHALPASQHETDFRRFPWFLIQLGNVVEDPVG